MLPYLIADSGSTKTEWRLISPNQPPVAIRTDGLNPYFQEEQQLEQTLRTQLLPHLPALLHAPSVYFYGTGCTGPASNERIFRAIQSIFPDAAIAVASDMLGAARGAAGHHAGLVCILGTGSNAGFFDGQQITTPGYSLGFWLGDEGSGGHLGKCLVTAYLHRQLPDELAQAFEQRFTLDRLTVLDHTYNRPYPNRYFAHFTPFLAEHRQSAFVRELVLTSFTAFLDLYVGRLPQHTQCPIHFVGSVAWHFADWLRETLLARQWQPGHFIQGPIDGLVAYHTHDGHN